MASLTPDEEFQTKCKIIEEIKLNHPNIYNKAHPKHYDKLKKEASFDEIGAIIGQSGKFCSMTKKDMFAINIYVIYTRSRITRNFKCGTFDSR